MVWPQVPLSIFLISPVLYKLYIYSNKLVLTLFCRTCWLWRFDGLHWQEQPHYNWDRGKHSDSPGDWPKCCLHQKEQIMNKYCICRIWGSHSGGYEEYCLLGYNAMYSVESQLTFRRNISPPSSGSKNKLRPPWYPVLVSYWFAWWPGGSQWVLAVQFCPIGEPTGTEFCSSISFLFPIKSKIPAGRLLCLPPAFTLVSCSAYFSTLKVEATCSSEMSVDFQWTTWCYIPEDSTLQKL
jgi:hypothetical protein